MNKDEILAGLANPESMRPKTERIACRNCKKQWDTSLTYVKEPGGTGVIFNEPYCPYCGLGDIYVVNP